MRKFKAVTESGTTYSNDGESSIVRISPSSGPGQAIKGRLITIPVEVVNTWAATGTVDWEYVRNAPAAEVPILGEHVAVFGMREWRIGTVVKTLEEYL